MAQPKFDISIGKDGKVTVKVHGVSGAECIKLTDMVRDIVGKEDSRKLTDEYHREEGKVRMDAHVKGKVG